MANKKNTKKANVTKVEEPKVKIEETVATVEVEPTVNVEETKLEVAKYRVILARPTYFIINKDGINVTIKKINNYKKGDIVTL